LVGSLLAVLMAKRGHKVDVYERRSDPRAAEQYAGRSINLVVSHRGWTALRAAGIDERIREITVPVYARMTHDPQGKTNRLPYSIENKAIYSVSRGELNNRLLSEAERMPGVTLHFGYRCDDVDLDKASCTFARKGEEPKTVKADVVLACDGAFSAVRAKMSTAVSTTARNTSSTITRRSPSPQPDGTRRWTRNACTSGHAATTC
jgi:kynurenine 3-monooxygenase